MNRTDDTIFALATPPGKSGVAVVRISGKLADSALAELGVAKLPKPRSSSLCALTHPKTRAPIDRALVLRFVAPHSFTGENIIELHIHGSRAVIQMLLEALGSLPGLRLAEPGEFSRRAFLNGKMDLTEAEGLADLIDAETAAQARQALRQASGALKSLYEDWRGQIITCMAKLEAYIDFPDEPLPASLEQEITADITALRDSLRAHLDDNRRGERLRDGVKIAIIGAPNAGKSSLLNYLARRDIAIVSPTPGTTRDALEVHLDISGFPVTLVDTAGIRESQDSIEQEGIRRSLTHAADADIILALLDGESYPAIPDSIRDHFTDKTIVAVTKCDASPCPTKEHLPISSKTGQGIDSLLSAIQERLGEIVSDGGSPLITRARHRQEIEQASNSLSNCITKNNFPIELRAEMLRQAATSLGKVTGRVDIEDVLDKLFSTFCIGK